jgi:transcription antitermination protein NusB
LGKRRKARELVLQFLFQTDMNPPVLRGGAAGISRKTAGETAGETTGARDDESIIQEEIASFWENFKTEEEGKSFFRQLAAGVMANRDQIDALINGASENWRISRMATVDRNILRLSVYELVYLDDIPPSVTINEAVEIAKRYGSEDSPSFVNGILDKIARTHSNKTKV